MLLRSKKSDLLYIEKNTFFYHKYHKILRVTLVKINYDLTGKSFDRALESLSVTEHPGKKVRR